MGVDDVLGHVSGSMAGRLQGVPKIVLARQALAEALLELDSEAFLVGFRAYGFDRSVAKTPEDSCPNTELLNPISRNQVGAIRADIDSLEPYGYTPLARSLELAGKDLLATESEKQMIILLTDGEESCGGDPRKVAADLRAMGIDVEVHIVGFDLAVEEAEILKEVATAGGGAYYDARNAKELGGALTRVIEVTADKVDPGWLRTISPVSGGATAGDATRLAPGTYTLTDHLPRGEEMFFSVATARGQHGVVRGLIQSRRLVRVGDEKVESDRGYAQYTIRIYGPDGAELGGRAVRLHGEPGSFGHVGFMDAVGDGFVFSISSAYDRVHKDALFNIEVVEAGDQYLGQEAGDTLTPSSPTLSLSEPVTGHLGDGDRKDVYRVLTGNAAPRLRVQLRFREPEFASRVVVHELSTGNRVHSAASRGEAYDFDIEVSPNETTGLMLEIRSNNPALREKFSSYELAITEGDIE